jgi:hypothetical protein
MSQNNEKSAHPFAAEIEYAAKLRLRGITPLSLHDQGYQQESAELSFLIGQLDENNLLPLVDQRLEQLRQQAEKQDTTKATPEAKPKRPTATKQPPREQTNAPQQYNFFGVVDQVDSRQIPIKHTTDWQNPERKLARLHNAFQRTDGHERAQYLSPDASRDAREFLKEIGVPTWTEKRQILTERYHLYITFLQDLGLWKSVSEQGVTDEIKAQLREVLKNLNSYMFDFDDSQKKIVTRFLRVILQESPTKVNR